MSNPCPNNIWNHTDGCSCVPNQSLQPAAVAAFPTFIAAEDEAGFSDEALVTLGGEVGRRAFDRLPYKPTDGTDGEDIAQEVRIALIQARDSGRLPEEWDQVRAYAHRLARNVAADQRWAGELRPEDRRAIGILRKWADASEQELGRPLNSGEWLRGYERVMAEWHDPRHKPTAAFKRYAANHGVLAARESSLDAMAEAHGGYDRIEEVSAIADQINGAGDDGQGPSSWVEKTNAMLDAPGKAAAAARRRMMWNVVAEHSDLPMARPALLSDKAAFRHRAALKDDEAVRAAADAYWDGEHSARVDALFAPYEPDGPDDRIRRKVADAFLNNPMARTNAHDLWDGALMFSAKRYAAESQRAWDA